MQVEALRVTKRFGALLALDDVSIALSKPILYGVLGENGAGKSTLLRVISGQLQPDAGEIRIDSVPLTPHTPAGGRAAGIGIVLQHFALVPSLSGFDNTRLAAPKFDVAELTKRLHSARTDLNLNVALDVPVATLGVSDRQRIELLRAVALGAKLLILDEPTTVLTEAESNALYTGLHRLNEMGTTVVVVTHKLDEVRQHAAELFAMRRGRVVAHQAVSSHTERRTLIELVMNDAADSASSLQPNVPDSDSVPTTTHNDQDHKDAPVVLALTQVSAQPKLVDCTLSLHAGEIVGLAGIDGHGQAELWEILGGLRAASTGIVQAPRCAVVFGDRHREGLVLDANLEENLLLGSLSALASHGFLDPKEVEAEALRRRALVGLDYSLMQSARSLSGGNQQKIVIARAIAAADAGAPCVALGHPTRGIDVKARAQVHDQIRRLAAQGIGILIQSSDLEELRALCTRIVVLVGGKSVVELPPSASDAEFGEWMLRGAS